MRTYVLFLVVLGSTIFNLGETIKCDQSIIDRIKAYWGDKGLPIHLLQTARSHGQELVLATTANYYTDDMKCGYLFFFKDKIGDRVSFTNVSTTGSADTTVVDVKESDGTISIIGTDMVRYFIVEDQGAGVTAFYRCNTDSGVEGNPEGQIKVRSLCFNQTVVDQAKEALKSVGVDIVKDYPAVCP